jgi:large subunit ribosomal protein L32e
MSEKKISPYREALKLRARARNKKPKFVRAESWKYDRFSLSWRKPRGLDNKIRRKIKGWPPGPSTGYKGPLSARFLHPSGYREVMVFNVADLSTIDLNTQAARIAHTVGKRKRALIIAEAKNLNIKLLNLKISKETEEEETEESEAEEAEAAEQKAPKEENKPKKETKKKSPKQTKPKKGEKKQ